MRRAGDQMDVFCSQCCKRVSLLNDLENRLKNLKTNRYNIDYSCVMCYERLSYKILFHPEGFVIEGVSSSSGRLGVRVSSLKLKFSGYGLVSLQYVK